MASVLAIVSQAVFAKMAPRGVAIGERVATDRYTSRHAAFTSLAETGSIFLVTVRPPDERLWLVGIVDRPRQRGGAWIGDANRTPIADITSAIAELVFSTGHGLKAKKGALGMSLQTPRILSAGDEALLRRLAGGTKTPAKTKTETGTETKPKTKKPSTPPKRTHPPAAGDRQAVVDRLLASWRERPAVAVAKAIEELAPMPELAAVTAGSAAEAFTRASVFHRSAADPRIASAVLDWIAAFKYHATSSRPFWRVAFQLLETSSDPRALTRLDEKGIPRMGATMRRWMKEQVIAARGKVAARFPDGPPATTRADAAELAKVVAAGQRLPAGAPARAGDEAALLKAVLEAPDDDGARSVYADWLLEHGDPRGDFIALQLARGRRAPTDDEERQETKLLAKHFRTWMGELVTATRARARHVCVRRGGNNRFERGFLVSTGLRGTTAALRRLAGHPLLATVERLDLSADLDVETAAALTLDPVMKSLAGLAVPSKLVARLVRTPLGDRLRELAVAVREPGEIVEIVETSRGLPRLARLRLDASGGYMGRGGRMVEANPTTADLGAAVAALQLRALARLEILVSGAQLILEPEGKGWALRLRTWDTPGPLAALLEVFARAPIRKLVNGEGTTATYQGGVVISRKKVALPAIVKRWFPTLKPETRGDEDEGEDDDFNENEGRFS